MRRYNESVQKHITDLICGLQVDTAVVDCLTYLKAASYTPFNIFGRVKINHLFIEAITTFGAQGGEVLFNYISTSPGIGAQGLSTACASVTGLDRGLRIMFVGGAVGAAVITATDCISDVICEAPHIVGVKDGYGTIGYQNSAVAVTSGTMQVSVFYTPMDDGSYMTPNW